jgi:hypothetical protein
MNRPITIDVELWQAVIAVVVGFMAMYGFLRKNEDKRMKRIAGDSLTDAVDRIALMEAKLHNGLFEKVDTIYVTMSALTTSQARIDAKFDIILRLLEERA